MTESRPDPHPDTDPDTVPDVDLVLPCRDEAAALRDLLPRVPVALAVIVVDNGSSDDTADIARAQGARVVSESRPGYGAAVHAGLLAATAPYVVVMDGDGSFEPTEALSLVETIRRGEADLALGRRVSATRGTQPWHARVGNRLVLAALRRRTGLRVHDIAPMRAARREALLELGVTDRRSGYPVELLDRAARAGWRVHEEAVAYHPRTAGTRSKVSGSVWGSVTAAYDFWRVLG